MKPKEAYSRMRRKIDHEDGFQEGEIIESWSGKRIGIAIFLTLIVVGGIGYGITKWTENTLNNPMSNFNVLGESNTEEIKLPKAEDIKKTLETAKMELEKISVENVTASDAAIQKIIKDLQSIQGGGKEPIDVVCELLCKR